MKGIIYVLMLLFVVGIVSAGGGTGNPSYFCTQEMKQCPDGSWATRGPDCKFNPCPVVVVNTTPGTTPINYQNNNIPCASAPLDQKIKCCADRGYTSYSDITKTCVFKIIDNSTNHSYMYDKGHDIKLNLTGLPNAIMRVRNNETADHLRQVLARIQAKRLAKLGELQNITFTIDNQGYTVAAGYKQAKLINIFLIKHTYSCTVQDDGTTLRNSLWYDFLFKDLDIDPCGVKVNTTGV